MKILTKQQLLFLLEGKADDAFLDEDYVSALFDRYGDEYYRGQYTEPLELCVENPNWDDWRKNGKLPRKGYQMDKDWRR